MGRFDEWVRSTGTDPDPRFTLANERTFLSWMTLSLGMLGIGLAVDTIVAHGVAVTVVAGLWIVLAAILALRAFYRWLRLERAMRAAQGLPLSSSIVVVAVSVAGLALVSGAIVLRVS